MSKSSSSKVQVHVGSLADMGARFIDAWERTQQGRRVEETHVTFLDLESMLAALSPRRLELLRHVHAHGASSVRELAAALGRDYKNVHQDVSALTAAGLLLREGRQLLAPWDEVQASLALN